MENKTNYTEVKAKKTVKEFVKEHKIAIAVGAATTVIAGMYLYTKYKEGVKITEKAASTVKFLRPDRLPATMELGAFGITEVYDYEGAIEVIGDYTVKVSDLGKFGEALATVDGITGDNKVYVLANVAKNLGENATTATGTLASIEAVAV